MYLTRVTCSGRLIGTECEGFNQEVGTFTQIVSCSCSLLVRISYFRPEFFVFVFCLQPPDHRFSKSEQNKNDSVDILFLVLLLLLLSIFWNKLHTKLWKSLIYRSLETCWFLKKSFEESKFWCSSSFIFLTNWLSFALLLHPRINFLAHLSWKVRSEL